LNTSPPFMIRPNPSSGLASSAMSFDMFIGPPF
jgi:hypothetical protein